MNANTSEVDKMEIKTKLNIIHGLIYLLITGIVLVLAFSDLVLSRRIQMLQERVVYLEQMHGYSLDTPNKENPNG